MSVSSKKKPRYPQFHDERVVTGTENRICEPAEHKLCGALGRLNVGRGLIFGLEPVIVQRDSNSACKRRRVYI